MAGGLVEVHWLPEPVVVADEYRLMALRFEQRQAVMEEALVVAEIDIAPRAKRRGWDSHRNPRVVSQYLRTIHSTESLEPDAKAAT